MSNTGSHNDVIEDNKNSAFEKSNSKDISIKEDNKLLDINFNDKYDINGKIFNEKQFNDNSYLNFETSDSKMADASMSTDVAEESEASSSTPLSLGIQKVPNGVIINSNVYLSDRNYHTIVSFDDGRGYCGVCEIDFEMDYQDHINNEEHLNNLKRNVPLCRYDLCIIRKLKENYHCGVCNQIFDMKKSNEHFSSKYHEDKLLFAVNRVSDIMYDLNIHKENKDSYHFDAKSINNINNGNDNDFGGFYDAYKLDSDHESTDESISDMEEINNPFSYASMTKKPQITPKFIEIEVDGKKMNVRFDSWHMVLTLKSNKYYCMVCKYDGHISLKIDHCVSEEHFSKLEKCIIVKKYGDFLIRKVDHRLCHCANCNNLQLIIDIEDHINKRHQKRKIKNLTEKNILNTTDLKNIEKNHENKGKTINNIVSLQNDIKELYIFCAKFNLSILSYNMIITKYCCICAVNCEDIKRHIIEVSHIENMNRCPFILTYNCNLIRLIKNTYHCAICNIIVQPNIINTHIMEENHVKLLNKIIILSPTTKIIKDIENSSENHTPEELNKELQIDNQKIHLNNLPKVIETEKNDSIVIKKDKNSIEKDKNESILMEKDKKSIEKDQNVSILMKKDKKSIESDKNESILMKKDKKSIEKDQNVSILMKKDKKSIESDKNESILMKKDKKSIETDKKESILVEKDKKSIEKDQTESILMKKEKKSIEIVDEKDIFDETYINVEELVFLKRKNVFARITLMSYNSLVPTGNKNKYCVLCSINIDLNKLKHHVDSRQHIDNMKKYKYLEKYDKHLFRQILHTYHCSLCNIMFTYREVNLHITWPIHKQQLDICHKIVKNNRKTDVKNGTKQITIDLQKEILFTTYIEPKIKIGIYYEFSKNVQEISKKSKIIINNGRVLKISWDSWNGFFKTKSGIKCCLCQKDLKTYEQTNHSNNCGHLEKLEDNFLNEFNPALIRKINENILNCVTCNTELPNKYHIIIEHIKGKKHENIYELLVKDSSICNNYTDCADDIFTLQ